MASEITIATRLKAVKGYLNQDHNISSQAVDLSGSKYSDLVQNIPTTAAGTALTLTGLGSAGWAWFRNLDTTNYIEIGVQVGGTFYPFAKLKPGEPALVRLGTTTPYARANTAAANLAAFVLED